MTETSALGKTEAITTASTPSVATPKVTVKGASGEFDSILKGLLPTSNDGSVSEEELFASLVKERIAALKGDDAAKKYEETLTSKKSALTKPNGVVPFEEAANSSLKSLIQSGVLTKDEGDQIYSEAFAGAQLDGNSEKLWDRIGGNGDPTLAIEKMEAALLSAKAKIDDLASGKSTLVSRTIDSAGATAKSLSVGQSGQIVGQVITPKGTSVDGANGFLFKPVSSNEGRLAVLLPAQMAHLVESVLIKDSAGVEIDKGRSTGFGDTGEREKFSFSKAGQHYPKDISVEVHMQDGTIQTYNIPDPSKRYD